MCTYFKTETEDHSIGKPLSEKKIIIIKNGGIGLVSEKRKLCMQNLTKEWKKPPVVILQQANFYNIFNLCLWLRIIRRSDQAVYFTNFPSQIFFDDINHGYRAALLKKKSLCLLPFLCDCGFLLLL